jgi:hypothetical protein
MEKKKKKKKKKSGEEGRAIQPTAAGVFLCSCPSCCSYGVYGRPYVGIWNSVRSLLGLAC